MTHIHDQTLPEGTQIGVYEIKGTLNVGAFDITYRGWNHHLKERVEIWEYFPQDFAMRASNGLGVEPKSPQDKENFDYGLKAFLDQADILTQIEHPNIVATENILSFNGTAYLIMVHQESVPLSKLVRSPATFAEAELKFILISILNALQQLHEHKMVHGGIQPATISLSKEGEPLLAGFSAARLAVAAYTDHLAGALADGYASAEQYELAHKSGPAADFYALGATMYYCITHRQPAAAQSRVLALGKGEPDPITPLSESPDIPYSAEFLQTITWMLQPGHTDRPQSVAEILAVLKPERASNPAESSAAEQDVAANRLTTNRYIWIGVVTGAVALAVVGLWPDEKSSEAPGNKPVVASTPPLFQRNPEKTVLPPEVKDDPSVAVAIAQPSQEPDLVKNPLVIQQETSKPDEEPKVSSRIEKPIDRVAIKKYLIAAEKAMKAGNFTTPAKDNAHKHYRMVLAIEPNNAEARAGLQKMVNRYIQFIEKASAERSLERVMLYLQRAESVLPDDPKLKRIRATWADRK
ncbi:MAG: protein kinase [Pseudomonadota bacterium]